jgi:hypothetical protein
LTIVINVTSSPVKNSLENGTKEYDPVQTDASNDEISAWAIGRSAPMSRKLGTEFYRRPSDFSFSASPASE